MPILESHSMEFISRSESQTRRAGMRLGTLLKPGDVVCLIGQLGSGKTTLSQGISAGWGSLDQVTSPTFVLLNVYRHPGGGQLFHLDAYRLNNSIEAEELDIEALIHQGPMVIEWADRIEEALPSERLWVSLYMIDESQRDFVITAQGSRSRELLSEYRKQLFGVP